MLEDTTEYAVIYQSYKNNVWHVWINNQGKCLMSESEAKEVMSEFNLPRGLHKIAIVKVTEMGGER